MPLQKSPIIINFGKGLNTKNDPNQLPLGDFRSLVNGVFDKDLGLVKRNGFPQISALPNAVQTNLTTLSDNLIATGSNLFAFSADTNQWLDQGSVQPINLSVQSMVRVSTSQTSPDVAITPQGLSCLAYEDSGSSYYHIIDSNTGQQIVARTALAVTATKPRVFLLGRYFIVTYLATVGGSPHLQYVAIPTISPTSPRAAADITTDVVSLNSGYDAALANNNLYFAWEANTSTVKATLLTSVLTLATPVAITSHAATLMSVTMDTSASTPVMWLSFWASGTGNGYAAAFDHRLNVILAPVQIINNVVISEITSVAKNQVLSVFYENVNNYDTVGSYPTASIRTDYLSKLTVTQAGSASAATIMLRSVGLASKAFYGPNDTIYMLAAYGPPTISNQPTYFLINSSGAIFSRLAYSNGGGYATTQVLPNVQLVGNQYIIPYRIADLLASVSTDTNVPPPPGESTHNIYTQTGINLAKFIINDSVQYNTEIAGVLNLTGGQLWQYDGVKPVENNFHVWPENVAYDTASTGGAVTAQKYYYVFCYEWTDNQGRLNRSAPSIPLLVDLTSAGTSTSVNKLFIPTDRLTYKTSPNPIRIVGYRWSVAQQVYYQFTSLTSPTLNNTATDYVTINDALADSSILGNTILYTTGGVVENIAAPASTHSALYQNRVMLIDAEDENLIWYSKQVIQNTPVEFSDLFTFYVAPTSGAQGSTGKLTAISAMDDKFIMFKADAIYYATGKGPDNTGANNDFSDPIFITSSVGCPNPRSIVLTPAGLMFQSDKGIWLLGRDLSTTYIGAPVEIYNDQLVSSALAIPGTNQVRFVISNGVTLMYDYYYGRWGTFSNLSSISDTLYQGKHTYLNAFGEIFQETPGVYMDGSIPVLMSFQTGWLNLAGLRGFERFYFLYLLGTYYSPFKINVQLSYDYLDSPQQSIIVTPDNYTPNWGGESVWGSGGPWGGTGDVFQAKIDAKQQKCQTFQITINELYDASLGVPAGQGLSFSGLNIVVGAKKGYSPQKGSRTFG